MISWSKRPADVDYFDDIIKLEIAKKKKRIFLFEKSFFIILVPGLNFNHVVLLFTNGTKLIKM